MKKKNKKEQNKIPMDKINAIKEFAFKMGYTTEEYEYTYRGWAKPRLKGKQCYAIELKETSDSEGNPYAWAWVKDTGESV